MDKSVRNGEYIAYGEFIAFKDNSDESEQWRVSRVSDYTHNSMKLTVIGIFYNKEDAIATMRRNGLFSVAS